MATNFPNSLDTLTNPNSTDSLSNPSHSQQHTNLNDAVEAIQAKIGADGSNDVNSIDYKISDIISQLDGLDNSTEAIQALLGLEGNNDISISGIENKTTIDSFSKTLYRTVRWVLQISRGTDFVTEALDLVQDGTDFHLQEYEISSNTSNVLATITLEENSGIINLCVTPTSTAVTARFYRTALKV